MDRKIKLLAVTSVAAITTAACTPQGGANAPHNQQTAGTSYTGSTTSPVTHSHSGKVHAHLLPATGIRHTHTTGSGATGGSASTQPTTTYRPPANTGSSGNNGMTHSHSGKVHTHRLPTTGINHTHRVGGGSAPAPVQPRPPVATGSSQSQAATRHDPNAHSHNGRVHSHRLPATGLNHGHNTGAATAPRRPPVANNYRPPATTTYRPPATNTYRPPANTYRPPAGNNSGGVAHKHNGRAHSHRLPASGMNHGHNAGATNRPVAPQTNTTNNGSSYYDYSSNNATTAAPRTNTNTAANTGSSSYYDYSSGSSSTYYNTAKPKASPNTSSSSYYDYSAPSPSGSTSTSSSSSSSTGSFAPNNYSGGNAYTVQRGDTVFQVMRNTGVYWKDIIRMNNLKAPNYQIVPGQRLKLR